MNVWDAIKEAASQSDITLRNLSRSIGSSPNYLHTIIYQKNVPQTDTLCDVLEACGYKLCAVREVPDKAIVIEQPRNNRE